jgi:hypothetical protein
MRGGGKRQYELEHIPAYKILKLLRITRPHAGGLERHLCDKYRAAGPTMDCAPLADRPGSNRAPGHGIVVKFIFGEIEHKGGQAVLERKLRGARRPFAHLASKRLLRQIYGSHLGLPEQNGLTSKLTLLAVQIIGTCC